MSQCARPSRERCAQVKDQSNSAYALRQIYQKHLQPYEQYCAEQEAANAKLESLSAPGQPGAALRKGEIGENMAAQVLGTMLAASAADAKGPGAALLAEEPPKKRRRIEQVTATLAVGAEMPNSSFAYARFPGECQRRFRNSLSTFPAEKDG